MKKIVLILIIISCLAECKGQSEMQPRMTKADYLKKSRHQSTAAWILISSGIVLTGSGIIVGINEAGNSWTNIFIGNSGESKDNGSILIYTGVASMLGSIPFFITSSRNKRNANSISAFLKLENRPLVQSNTLTKRSYPALGIKINL